MAGDSDQKDNPMVSEASGRDQTIPSPSPLATDSPEHSPKPRLAKKLILTAAILAIGALAAGMWYLMSTREPVVVCGSEMVERHNSANRRGGSHDGEIREIAQEIESIENYKEDPTCVSMVYYYYAYQAFDYEKTKEHLEVLRVLTEEGRQIDSDLISGDSIERMESHFKNMDPDFKYEEEQADEIVI